MTLVKLRKENVLNEVSLSQRTSSIGRTRRIIRRVPGFVTAREKNPEESGFLSGQLFPLDIHSRARKCAKEPCGAVKTGKVRGSSAYFLRGRLTRCRHVSIHLHTALFVFPTVESKIGPGCQWVALELRDSCVIEGASRNACYLGIRITWRSCCTAAVQAIFAEYFHKDKSPKFTYDMNSRWNYRAFNIINILTV